MAASVQGRTNHLLSQYTHGYVIPVGINFASGLLYVCHLLCDVPQIRELAFMVHFETTWAVFLRRSAH
jgi:uncharacterized membrane protein YdcZ (DUF606 family)